MSDDQLNADRRRRAITALRLYALDAGLRFDCELPGCGDGWETVIVDLLADIQHFLDTPANPVVFEDCVRLAQMHHEEETTGSAR